MRLAPPTAKVLVLLMVAAAVAHALYATWRNDWTLDERVHLEWSRRLLDEGVTERASQGRFDSKTAFSVIHVLAHRAGGGSFESARARVAARVPTVFCLLALFVATFGLAREVFGGNAGWVALALATLDPNLVAHGSVATVDVPYALGATLTLWTGLRFARNPSPWRGLAVGASLGLGLLAKFTGVLLLPGLLMLVVAIDRTRRREWLRPRALGALALVPLAAAAVLCTGYLFHEVGRALASLDLRSGIFRGLAEALPGLRLPLPSAFIGGLDRSLVSERTEWGVVVLGRRYPHGVWFYYFVVWPLKTPLLILAAQIAGTFAAARAGLLRHAPALFVLGNLLLNAAYFSFLFKTQLGYRFVLMCIPLLAALAAPGLIALAGARWRGWATLAAAFTLIECAPYLGNPLSFTNAAVQPKRLAFRVLADSNLDWGQNRDKIAGWMAQRGIPAPQLDPLHVLPGTNVITLNALTGAGVFDFERHRWLRENAEPIEHLGHTYLVFDIDDALYDRMLQESRLRQPAGRAAALCGEEGEPAPPGSKIPFAVDGVARPGRGWLVCISTARGTDIGLRGFRGGIRLGPVAGEEEPPLQTVLKDQALWFRLEPGRHAFVVRQMENRRAWLPAPFEGEWHVRRRGARLSIRESAFELQ